MITTTQPLTKEELIGRYQTLLITLARAQLAMASGSMVIRDLAKTEPASGRRAGMNCKANELSKQAHELSRVIHRHNLSMRHFFDTTNLDEVARKPIPSDDYTLTDSLPSLDSPLHDKSNGRSNRAGTSSTRVTNSAKTIR